MKIDINKKYRYRMGEPARILCADAPGDSPVVTVTPYGIALNHKSTGKFGDDESTLDLIEVREPREFEVVVSTPQNTRFKQSEIDGRATDDLCIGIRDVSGDAWEIIRVREIIE